MEIKLTKQSLLELAKQLAPLIAKILGRAKPEPDWIKLEDIRADLFAGKSKSWVRLYVFDQFPEIQVENGQPGAWVMGVHGTGKVTKIYLPYARPWMLRSTGLERRYDDGFIWTNLWDFAGSSAASGPQHFRKSH